MEDHPSDDSSSETGPDWVCPSEIGPGQSVDRPVSQVRAQIGTSASADSQRSVSSRSPAGLEQPVSPPLVPYHEYDRLARDRDFLWRQNAELQRLLDRVVQQSNHRVSEADLDWVARVFCFEEDTRACLIEGTSEETPEDRASRLDALVQWMLAELAAIRTQQRG